ncbi:MAG: hypothetical protein GY870_09205 [archaeon]|nr:hypothetical protein [archaeon]
MTIGSKEHYDLLEDFEKNFKGYRLDRENKDLWKIGQVYQNGDTNTLYKAYQLGYALGRVNYLN